MKCKVNIYVFKEMLMLKKLFQSVVFLVDGSDIFFDNYKDSIDIYNIFIYRFFMFYKINLNYKIVVKSNIF